MKLRSSEQETSLEARLVIEAQSRRERALQLPPGKERETLLKEARQDEILAEWLYIAWTTPAKVA
jgi:hypothetical protein